MKIWIKLFAATVIGILLGLFLPNTEGKTSVVFFQLAGYLIRVGRFVLFPLVFFSLSIGVYELQMEKKALRVYSRTFLYIVISSALAVIFGTLMVFLLSPQRIPIIIKQQEVIGFPTLREVIHSLFPTNLFNVIVSSGDYLLPIAFFAFFLGINLSFDKTVTRPVTHLLEALSRVFEHMNSLIVEIISLASIILAANMTFQLRLAEEISLFIQLVVTITAIILILVLGIYPLLFYLFSGKSNPYKGLYGSLAPALTGLVSGDTYFSTTMLFRHGRENLGIPRKVNSTTFTAFALFGKAGTALVTAVSFIVILKSYSSLGITISQILWISLFSFLFSFITGPFPGTGVLITLSALCGLYGKGLEEGYLILQPILPLLISLSVFLDIITTSLVSVLVAKHEGLFKEPSPEEFV